MKKENFKNNIIIKPNIVNNLVESEKDDLTEYGTISIFDNIVAYYEVYNKSKEVKIIKRTGQEINDVIYYINSLFPEYSIKVCDESKDIFSEKNKFNHNVKIITSYNNDNIFRIILNGRYIGFGRIINENIYIEVVDFDIDSIIEDEISKIYKVDNNLIIYHL